MAREIWIVDDDQDKLDQLRQVLGSTCRIVSIMSVDKLERQALPDPSQVSDGWSCVLDWVAFGTYGPPDMRAEACRLNAAGARVAVWSSANATGDLPSTVYCVQGDSDAELKELARFLLGTDITPEHGRFGTGLCPDAVEHPLRLLTALLPLALAPDTACTGQARNAVSDAVQKMSVEDAKRLLKEARAALGDSLSSLPDAAGAIADCQDAAKARQILRALRDAWLPEPAQDGEP